MVENAMSFNHLDEIGRREPRECGFGKGRIRCDEIFGRCMQVGEITPAPAGNQNLPSGELTAFENRDFASAFSSLNGAHQTSCAPANDDNVEVHAAR